MDEVVAVLERHADEPYRRFTAGLVPNVSSAKMIGVRMPVLREYAHALARDAQLCRAFMDELPHAWYEENNLHALLINEMSTSFETAYAQVETFLPTVNNWATCDVLNPRALLKDRKACLDAIAGHWLPSKHTFTCRFGINMLRLHFLGDAFQESHFGLVAHLPNGDYYVDMARAWYFCEALAVRFDQAVKVFEPSGVDWGLDPWTHNKSLQKACESNRLKPEVKRYLKSLKVPQKSR